MDPSEQQYNNYKTPSLLQDDRPINWRKYIFLFLTNWYWFLITIFIAISIAYLKNRYTLPQFQASATLLIEDQESTDDILTEIRSVRRRRAKADLANEIAKLRAFSLHRRTIDSLGWDIFWTGHGRVAMERPLYKNPPYYLDIDSVTKAWYKDKEFHFDRIDENYFLLQNKDIIDTVLKFDNWHDIMGWKFRVRKSEFTAGYASYSFIFYNPNTLSKIFSSKIAFEANEERGTVITIRSTGPLSGREIDYINMLCENYIYTGLDRKRIIAENTLEFVNDQIYIILDSLQKAEKQLIAFRVNNSIVDLSTEGNQAYEKLQNFYNQKTQLKLKQNYYEYLKEYIESKHDPQAIVTPILLDAQDKMLITQVESLQQLYEERELLEFAAAGDNPGLIQFEARIQNARLKILEIISALLQNNELARKQIDTEEKRIEEQLLSLPVSEQELVNIKRKFEVNNQFYTFLLEKRAEAGIQRASTVSNVRILDQATVFHIRQVGTRKMLIYLIAFLLGIVVPGGIIYLADSMDNRIKDRNDIEDNTDIPILGVVSHSTAEHKIPVYERPGDAFTESFRHIRTNLQYILHEPDQKVIMITSTLSGEGKTFIAINLASILAMTNKKVLIGGFDLRRPSLHRIFSLENSRGISTYLAGHEKIEDIIQQTDIKNLDVMIAGPVPPNPAELLGLDRLPVLIDKVSENYDYIVIDTPPVALVTDATLISKHTDANIFIIRQNFSPKGVFDIIHQLKDKQIKNLSLLVNDIRESKAFGYRYYYGYGYGYGYSYGYQYLYGNEYYNNESRRENNA